jgi:hypothetical protein
MVTILRSPGGYGPVGMGPSLERRGGKSYDLVQGLLLFPNILSGYISFMLGVQDIISPLGLNLVLKICTELLFFHFAFRTLFDCGADRSYINPKPFVRNHPFRG